VRFRNWYREARAGDATPDPDEPVELVVVSGPIGPMTVANLRTEGFRADGFEIASWKGIGKYRIFVPRHELAEATEFLNSLL
jgi:hypothetical protein